jgi:hypothetical protein
MLEIISMKRNPTPENRGVRTRVARADSRSHPRIDVKPEPFGLTTLSDIDAVRKTKREIWRTVLAIKQAGCRDVLIVRTAEYVRFIVTIKLPKTR